jgi:hypothetical protein
VTVRPAVAVLAWTVGTTAEPWTIAGVLALLMGAGWLALRLGPARIRRRADPVADVLVALPAGVPGVVLVTGPTARPRDA